MLGAIAVVVLGGILTWQLLRRQRARFLREEQREGEARRRLEQRYAQPESDAEE